MKSQLEVDGFCPTPLKKNAISSNWDPSSPKKKSRVNINKNYVSFFTTYRNTFPKKKRCLSTQLAASASTPQFCSSFRMRNWGIYKSSLRAMEKHDLVVSGSQPPGATGNFLPMEFPFFSRNPAPGLRRHGMCAGGSGYTR